MECHEEGTGVSSVPSKRQEEGRESRSDRSATIVRGGRGVEEERPRIFHYPDLLGLSFHYPDLDGSDQETR